MIHLVFNVQLEILNLAVCMVEGGIFEVYYTHLQIIEILAIVVHDLKIFVLYWYLVVDWVSYLMKNGDRAVGCLEKNSVTEGNYGQEADEIDWWVGQRDYYCSVHFVYNFLIIPNCCLGIIANQIIHPIES